MSREARDFEDDVANGTMMDRLGPALAMADSINRALYPPRLTLVLPLDWWPELESFYGYNIVHADVEDAIVGVPGYRIRRA